MGTKQAHRGDNLKISTKILCTFLAFLVLMIAVFGYMLVSLTQNQRTSEELFENYGNAQGYLGNILNCYQMQYIAMSDILLFQTPDVIANRLEVMDIFGETMQDALSSYKAVCEAKGASETYLEIEGYIDRFNILLDEFSMYLGGGDFEACRTLFTSPETDAICILIADFLFLANDQTIEDANVALAAQHDAAKSANALTSCMMGGIILLVVISIILVSRSITRPMLALAASAKKLAKGNTDIDVQAYLGNSEPGQLAYAFMDVVKALRHLIEDMQQLEVAGLHGQLSTRADVTRHEGDYRRIVEGVNGTLDAVIAPIQEASDVLGHMCEGDISVRVRGHYEGDHAIIQNALNETLNNINAYIEELSFTLGEMRRSNFNVNICSDFKGDFAVLKAAVNDIAASISDVIRNIDGAATQVALGASQVANGAQAISQGATEQASSVEELTVTVTEISAQVKETAANTNDVLTVSRELKALGMEGNTSMGRLQGAMEEISASATDISKIIKVIDDIAFQTNILALNAAVEAARAGIHGKGFAVVAEEVRNLAAKSAAAARETTLLIEGSIAKSQVGTETSNATALSLQKIIENLNRTEAIIADVATATNEEAVYIEQVNKGITQMSEVIQVNSATAEQSAATTQELSSQASLLKELIASFQVQGASSASAIPMYAGPLALPSARE